MSRLTRKSGATKLRRVLVGAAGVSALVAGGALAAAAPGEAGASTAGPTTVTFTTVGTSTWAVPGDVCKATFAVSGGQGGAGGSYVSYPNTVGGAGGLGGRVVATVGVTQAPPSRSRWAVPAGTATNCRRSVPAARTGAAPAGQVQERPAAVAVVRPTS